MILEEIYKLRNSFIVIGLTGRKGSEYSKIADILTYEDSSWIPEQFHIGDINHNNKRKYNIAQEYLVNNWKPFKIIKYKDVLSLIILYNKFDSFLNYLCKYKEVHDKLKGFNSLKRYFNKLYPLLSEFKKPLNKIKTNKDFNSLYGIFFNSAEFQSFSNKLHSELNNISPIFRIKFLQTISNNCRKTSNPYLTNSNEIHIYYISEIINRLIKSYRENNNKEARIIIDSLRNPYEIMFFKERYSAFYMMAVNSRKKLRDYRIEEYYREDTAEILSLDEDEYEPKEKDVTSQDIAACIQKSDIHLNSSLLDVSDDLVKKIGEDDLVKEKENPDFICLYKHLVQYISLILHPGIITPTPQERCMQIAYNAKYNSGCISRQVGAVITDEYFSVKGIGWNNTPEGQVPCLLRNIEDLVDSWGNEDKFYNSTFSEYERTDANFKNTVKEHYDALLEQHHENFHDGYCLSYCFKNIQNCISEGKNQVHTRSLHAEENAFLQISKYGGQGIFNGYLFTTASPCELCSKKAYQLGIKKIYYIDPYPGIAKNHILKGAEDNPEIILFTGAIGEAFHKLYEPFMAFKDELTIAKGLIIDDKTKQLEKEVKRTKEMNTQLIEILKENQIECPKNLET